MIAAEKRQISIDRWYSLVDQGIVLPMCIPLEGDSMGPLIRRNRDLVHILPLGRPLKRGDVVLFELPPGRYVVHRVYQIKEGYVQTFGDHCWNPDPWIPADAVLGVAVMVDRDGVRISLDNAFARILGLVWMAGFPIRCGYWKLKALAGRCLCKIRRRR